MKFTVERAVPVKMLELVGKKTPTQKRRDKSVRLSACAARVFVEANDSTAGIEALVLEDGTCLLPYDHFLKLLKSHAPRINISMEANETAIRFATTALPVTEYSSAVKPPGQFQRFTARRQRIASYQQTENPNGASAKAASGRAVTSVPARNEDLVAGRRELVPRAGELDALLVLAARRIAVPVGRPGPCLVCLGEAAASDTRRLCRSEHGVSRGGGTRRAVAGAGRVVPNFGFMRAVQLVQWWRGQRQGMR